MEQPFTQSHMSSQHSETNIAPIVKSSGIAVPKEEQLEELQTPLSLNRRAFLTGAASLATVTLAKMLAGPRQVGAQVSRAAMDPTRVPGRLASPYGTRSSSEHISRLTSEQRSLTTPSTSSWNCDSLRSAF